MSSVPFSPRPDQNCVYCHGFGYVVRPRGEHAEASACSCVPRCSRCDDTGRAVVTVDGVTKIGRCRCRMLHDRVRLFNAAQIPSRHASSSFRNFDLSEGVVMPAFMAAMRWAEDYQPGEDNQGLIFWGLVGRGKTHLLVATLRHVIFTHGVNARFVEFSRLLSELKAGYSAGRSDAPLLEELSAVPILGIDELGKGRLSEWEMTIIDEVVSRRYNAMGCMLGSTNYRPRDPTGAPPPNLAVSEFDQQSLGDRVGWRVHSRLKQMCRFVQTRGQDYRDVKGQSARLSVVPPQSSPGTKH